MRAILCRVRIGGRERTEAAPDYLARMSRVAIHG